MTRIAAPSAVVRCGTGDWRARANLERLYDQSSHLISIVHGTMGSTRLITVAFVRYGGAWANAGFPIVLLGPRLYIVTFAPRARRCLVTPVLIRPVPPTMSAFNMLRDYHAR